MPPGVANEARRINIVFLAGDPLDWWSMDTLYRATRADRRFAVQVVSVGFSSWLGIATDCDGLFEQLGISALDGRSQGFDLAALAADVIVTSSPYDQYRPAAFQSSVLANTARLVYIPYGVDFAGVAPGLGRLVFGQPTQQAAWRIFSRSVETSSQYARYGGIARDRVVGLGLPVLDPRPAPFVRSLPEHVIDESANKVRILYTPHHSLWGWSTFVRHGRHIRSLLANDPRLYVVFRPHPGLMPQLASEGVMSQADFRSFFSGPRCHLDESDDYDAAFRWSDFLVTDASSFLVQYAPTRKPVVYLHWEGGWGLDETIRGDVFGAYYVAQSAEAVSTLVRMLSSGHDPLVGQRTTHQARMSVGLFNGDAGLRISQYLANELTGGHHPSGESRDV